MATPRIGGPGIGLNLNGAFGSQLPGSSGSFGPIVSSNAITLAPSQVQPLPAGTFYVSPGPVTSLQWLDPVTTVWRTINATPNAGGFYIDADSGNYRLANLTGTVIGAVITNAGSGYVNGIGTAATGLTITPSAGGSVWVPVVGGVNNGTVTITAGGSNYSFAPTIVCSAPPTGGIPMTAVCTVAAGAINAVSVTNPGAGYTAPATLTVINDYRDSTGSGAVLTAGALVQSGGLAAMYPSGAQNAAFNSLVGGNGVNVVVPVTFTFSPASTTAATSIMNFCLLAAPYGSGTLTISAGGTGEVAGSTATSGTGNLPPAAAANTAGLINGTGIIVPRLPIVQLNISGGVVQAGSHVVLDPGFGLQGTTTVNLIFPPGATQPTGTCQIGGIADTSYVQPF
jgi:hypothetical protein